MGPFITQFIKAAEVIESLNRIAKGIPKNVIMVLYDNPAKVGGCYKEVAVVIRVFLDYLSETFQQISLKGALHAPLPPIFTKGVNQSFSDRAPDTLNIEPVSFGKEHIPVGTQYAPLPGG